MMENLRKITMSRLPNASHMEFVNSVAKAVSEISALQTIDVAKSAVERLLKARDAEDANFKRMMKSEFTPGINEQDKIRDRNFSVFKKTVKTFKVFPDERLSESASHIWEVLRLYRINVNMRMDSKTALIDNLIQDLDEQCTADVAVLNLAIVLDNLRSANENVRQLVALRTSERASRVLWALRNARQESDASIKHVLKAVEAMAFLFGNDDFVRFAGIYNTLVDRYKRYLPSSASKAVDKADCEDVEEPEMAESQIE